MRNALLSAALAAAFTLIAAPASAQATRTWVSGVGDDVNPCSRTAPCKTFAGAISKTAAGGEISVLDPAGYGAVTITKSISIVADGAEGSVLAAGVNGIIINAGANDAIYLKGLMLEGAGTGTNGIRFLAGGELNIQDLVIRGFQAGPGVGIDIQPITNARVYVSNTLVARNNAGIVAKSAPPPANALGAITPVVSVFLDDVKVVQNKGAGITADGASAAIRLNNSTVFGNGGGLASANSGQIISFGNNAIASNGADGAPAAKAPLQ
jgi:hypothetical protein